MSEIFADHLKKIRRSKNFKQADLARKTGLKVAAISFYETGERRPSLSNLVKLADALSVSVDFLLGREVARVRDFDKLNPKDQEVIQEMAKVLLKKTKVES
jgi:transcriptional regulator with XRE-family HTH domain